MELRPYQERGIAELYAWFEAGNEGNPCIVMPTGSGKSHMVAEICRRAVQEWPETRILMATHVKELIEQNMEKMLGHWPGAPLGIYSAGMGIKQLGHPITFASIQSIIRSVSDIGLIDLMLIDECHLVNHENQGMYRTLIEHLKAVNPKLRVIGFTATPYRLGHGYITDAPAIFNALLEPVTIEELIQKKYLAPLKSKKMEEELSTDGVGKRGGEYISGQLQDAVNTPEKNKSVVDEILERAGDRKSWLVFCSGIKHAEDVKTMLSVSGIHSRCVTGETPKILREATLGEFRDPRRDYVMAITNANVLTTGFDHPDLDLIAMLRPTLSPGLYVQMAGRGMRIKSHTDHCLVLDFAGNVAAHGPITDVSSPKKKGEGTGEAPVKVCDVCNEYCHAACKVCPDCGAEFPEPERKALKLHNDDIMGIEGEEMAVNMWRWRRHVSRSSGRSMLMVSYYGKLSDPIVSEYLVVNYEGYAGRKATNRLFTLCYKSKGDSQELAQIIHLDDIADYMSTLPPPKAVKYKKDGRFFKVIGLKWKGQENDSSTD